MPSKYRNPPSEILREDFKLTRNIYAPQVPLHIHRDLRLNGEPAAKLIILELLSYVDDYTINKTLVYKTLGFSRDKFNKGWKLLTDIGYISSKRMYQGVKWSITDNPDNLTHWKSKTKEEIKAYVKSKKGLE